MTRLGSVTCPVCDAPVVHDPDGRAVCLMAGGDHPQDVQPPSCPVTGRPLDRCPACKNTTHLPDDSSARFIREGYHRLNRAIGPPPDDPLEAELRRLLVTDTPPEQVRRDALAAAQQHPCVIIDPPASPLYRVVAWAVMLAFCAAVYGLAALALRAAYG
jgi:hypothetical protein